MLDNLVGDLLMKNIALAFVAVVCAILVACGGGGGSSVTLSESLPPAIDLQSLPSRVAEATVTLEPRITDGAGSQAVETKWTLQSLSDSLGVQFVDEDLRSGRVTIQFAQNGSYVFDLSARSVTGLTTTTRYRVIVDVTDHFDFVGTVSDGGALANGAVVWLEWQPLDGAKIAQIETAGDGEIRFERLIGSLADFTVNVIGD